MLVPVLIRHRVHRLARSFSHGWLIPPNRKVAILQEGPEVMPSLRSRQVSRGYSLSQPPGPSARAATWRCA